MRELLLGFIGAMTAIVLVACKEEISRAIEKAVRLIRDKRSPDEPESGENSKESDSNVVE